MIKPKVKPVGFILLIATWLIGGNLLLGIRVGAERNIVFPVIGSSTFGNDFYASRGDHIHHAIDIIASKGKYLVAAVSGTITDVQYPQPSWGYSITIRDDDGYRYTYLHMNDDTPGTNDGDGGPMHAYAADMKEGNLVRRGQLIGWVGDSGNSNGVSHLHFEIRKPNGDIYNPYQSLVHASRISKPVVPGRVTTEMLPFGRYIKGGASMAMGNLDLDPQSETIIGGGKGNLPRLQYYQDGDDLVENFYIYDSSFRGGIDVATGDINGDGIDEVITGAGVGGPPQVKVFNASGAKVNDFPAFASHVKNGINVAAGDVTGDGKDEIIIGLGAGRDPWVKVFNMASGLPVLLYDFLAYQDTFEGGVDVASGNVRTLSLFDEIVTAPGPGGGPQIRILQGNGTYINDFLADSQSKKHGMRVSVGNVRTSTVEAEILTVPMAQGRPVIKMFNSDASLLSSNTFLEEWWIGGGYDVAAGFDFARVLTGVNRRISVRPGLD